MKMKNLLLICGAALTLTACSQNVPASEDAAAISEETAITDEAESASETVPEDSVEESADLETPAASEEESEESGVSFLNPPEIAFQENGDTESMCHNLKATFNEDVFADYLYENQEIESTSHHIVVFGFNSPEGYDSDIPEEEKLPQPDWGVEEKMAIQVDNFQANAYPEYPSRYAFLNFEDYSSVCVFLFSPYDGAENADAIRDYLQNDTPISTLSTDYPMFLNNATVTSVETMDTIDTIYGSCDILFMELEAEHANEDSYQGLDNPIYIEAAYLSLKTLYEESGPDVAETVYPILKPEIAVVYTYPKSGSDLSYEGHLAQLLPDMLTPAAQ